MRQLIIVHLGDVLGVEPVFALALACRDSRSDSSGLTAGAGRSDVAMYSPLGMSKKRQRMYLLRAHLVSLPDISHQTS